ncbi:MAG: DUF3089 domain-containing protein [Halioglobus sp.]
MKVIKVFGVTAAAVILLGIVLTVTGWGGTLFFKAFIAFNKPSGDFNPAEAVAPPDYSQTAYWASLPTIEDPADLTPAGIEVKPQGEHPVDVFFIHPTGFLTSGSWTSPMDPDSGTEENTRFMMANQASAFNGCCNIYAPRYREANIFAYFGSTEDRDELLGFAYQDVKRAFEHYLEHDNQDKPFILAGHSQGSHHAQRLLKEVIDTTDLHQRLVAAYVIGSTLMPVSKDWFSSMSHINACESAGDLACVVHWDTMPEGTPAYERPGDSLCTNPLSWQVNEVLAQASLNEGAVVPVGTLNQAIGRVEDKPSQQIFDSLKTPREEFTWAQCLGGTLYANKALGEGFEIDAMGTYHQADYALFYMNIHHNAKLRASRHTALQHAP